MDNQFTPEQLVAVIAESIDGLVGMSAETQADEYKLAEDTLVRALDMFLEGFDEDDDEEMSAAEKKLASMGTKLDKSQRTVLQQAEERTERRALKKAKKAKLDDDEAKKSKVTEEGVEASQKALTESIASLKRLAGVPVEQPILESCEPQADVYVVLESSGELVGVFSELHIVSQQVKQLSTKRVIGVKVR